MFKKVRPYLSIILLLIALGAGVYYLLHHQALLRQLKHTSIGVTVAVFGLYIVMLGVLVWILDATLRLCRRRLEWRENAELNTHSLLVNFFVPGQGGIAYRGVYLYKKHRLKVKQYIAASLLYFLVYIILNVFLMFVTNRPWWQTLLALIAATGAGLFVIRKYGNRSQVTSETLNLRPKVLAYLAAATLVQAFVQFVIYATELHTVNSGVALSQVVTYTGAADLTLFVSLTPGAIGIREAFLIFTHHLHHISSANIIAANVIDRGVYIVFLLIVLLVTITLQGRRHLRQPAEHL